MLTVNLHLCNGDVIAAPMTSSQRDRVSRTLNQAALPVLPLEVVAGGATLLIPWRSIAYLSTLTPDRAGQVAGQAAD